MKTILVTAYAVDPYKGSEDGMGWNFIRQIAKNNQVIAITRRNNRKHIERYMEEVNEAAHNNITFAYFDLPYWMRFWKRGGRGALIYFYLWQLFMPVFILFKRWSYDIVHNLNFHNDWTPSFLWVLGKPFVWGPVGHHPYIPEQYWPETMTRVDKVKLQSSWCVKNWFWNYSIPLMLTRKFADKVLCMNTAAAKVLDLPEVKYKIVPSVATYRAHEMVEKERNGEFNILFAGRLVNLKGYDVAMKSFARFYHKLEAEEQKHVTMTFLGDGPERKHLKTMIRNYGLERAVKVIHWVEHKDMPRFYNIHQVFFFPSHEGAGMVVAEALSFGLPVVCFDNVGPGEFVNENCGLKVCYNTCNTNTTEAFAKHLLSLYRNRDLWKKLSDGAFKRYEEHYKWDVRGEQLEEVYDELYINKVLKVSPIKQRVIS